MNNLSENGKSILLNIGKKYLFIDALYLDDLIEKFDLLDFTDLENEIREKVFPFPNTDTPFATYTPTDSIFTVEKIKKAKDSEVDDLTRNSFFSTDVAMLVIINIDILIEILKLNSYSYDKLVDANLTIINFDYWSKLASHFESKDIALIIAPGLDSGFDFEGSGTYQIR